MMSWRFSGRPLFMPGAGLGPRFRGDDEMCACRRAFTGTTIFFTAWLAGNTARPPVCDAPAGRI
jgi:hypothetical protein